MEVSHFPSPIYVKGWTGAGLALCCTHLRAQPVRAAGIVACIAAKRYRFFFPDAVERGQIVRVVFFLPKQFSDEVFVRLGIGDMKQRRKGVGIGRLALAQTFADSRRDMARLGEEIVDFLRRAR